eukprot:6174545-Pleurochrysis_carterae.AAC.1
MGGASGREFGCVGVMGGHRRRRCGGLGWGAKGAIKLRTCGRMRTPLNKRTPKLVSSGQLLDL